MYKYLTEMDGFSVIVADKELDKNVIVFISSSDDKGFYKVSKVDECKVEFRLMKYVEPLQEETKNQFSYNDKMYSFENRLSKNQNVLLDDKLYTVKGVDKKTKELDLEEVDYINVCAQYGVYEVKEGRSVYDREIRYEAEKYFYDHMDAIGYVMQERQKGRKVSC